MGPIDDMDSTVNQQLSLSQPITAKVQCGQEIQWVGAQVDQQTVPEAATGKNTQKRLREAEKENKVEGESKTKSAKVTEHPSDIRELLLQNTKILNNIQDRMNELSDMSKVMNQRVQKLEKEQKEDHELLSVLQEECCETRESLTFLHSNIKDITEEVGAVDTRLQVNS